MLDIDETLVHVVRSHEKMTHTHVIKLSGGGRLSHPVDVRLNIRPNAYEFLQEVQGHCNLALMTASHKTYADQIYKLLDPEKKFLCGVYSKDHCVNYTKGR